MHPSLVWEVHPFDLGITGHAIVDAETGIPNSRLDSPSDYVASQRTLEYNRLQKSDIRFYFTVEEQAFRPIARGRTGFAGSSRMLDMSCRTDSKFDIIGEPIA